MISLCVVAAAAVAAGRYVHLSAKRSDLCVAHLCRLVDGERLIIDLENGRCRVESQRRAVIGR